MLSLVSTDKPRRDGQTNTHEDISQKIAYTLVVVVVTLKKNDVWLQTGLTWLRTWTSDGIL
jgi:hypothetical protein